MPRLQHEFKRNMPPSPPTSLVITVPRITGEPMKIRVSRTVGAVALSSALVASGLVFAESAQRKPPPAPRGQAAEYASMCKYCESATNGACYAFHPKTTRSLLADAGTDGGVITEGACTYPPCSPVDAMMNLAELKLACATCRAICPNTSGGPGRAAVEQTPDQRR